MILPVWRCGVICPGLLVGSLDGGKTRTPSSIGGSKRLNGQGLTEQKLREEIGAKKQKKTFQVPPSYVELIQNRVSSGKMVPRDRIELSTPAFSGLCSTN